MDKTKRINITNEHKEGVIAKLDSTGYFNLSELERVDLYNFAMAMGLNCGEHTPFTSKKESLVKYENIKNNAYVYEAVYFVDELKGDKDKVAEIENTEFVYGLTDEYANKGFDIIESFLDKYDEDVLIDKLMSEMDDMYKINEDEIVKL